MDEEGLKTRAYCNSCGRETHHIPLHKHEETIEEKEGNFTRQKNDCWELLKCCGCDEIRVRQVFNYIGLGQPQIRYYPPVEIRRLPKWACKLPEEVRELQLEVYSAMHGNNLRLATMGARTLIDMAILVLVGDKGTFDNKLDAMIKEKYLAERDKSALMIALDTGSAASHRGHKPTFDDLNKVMDIVEHLLEQVFYLQGLGDKLKNSVPPRKTESKGG
ncbi:MAG: DUF4145 domain-containing protein [Planctomycetota bacterium]|nr:DUF4145 domain-containing protein [Planctomycetota bacterium]